MCLGRTVSYIFLNGNQGNRMRVTATFNKLLLIAGFGLIALPANAQGTAEAGDSPKAAAEAEKPTEKSAEKSGDAKAAKWTEFTTNTA